MPTHKTPPAQHFRCRSRRDRNISSSSSRPATLIFNRNYCHNLRRNILMCALRIALSAGFACSSDSLGWSSDARSARTKPAKHDMRLRNHSSRLGATFNHLDISEGTARDRGTEAWFGETRERVVCQMAWYGSRLGNASPLKHAHTCPRGVCLDVFTRPGHGMVNC